MWHVTDKHHYHVAAICEQLSLPSIVTKDEIDAMLEMAKMVEFIHDQTGLEVRKSDDKKAIFFDGSTVRMFKCFKDCLIPNLEYDAAQLESEKRRYY